ncbi:hypothetical protein ABT341_05795 [Pseudonocardia alni]|uniref:hypothetical protein n=1 Tax=Pseudonocardia alni TaxID=33907 RepID=UPI003319D577
MILHRRARRSVPRLVLAAVVPATTAAALCVASFASAAPVIAGPTALPAAASGPSAVTRDFPAPVVPDGIVPAAPLESFVPEPVVYTCEPWADAEFGDPAHPDDITNKACPELNAAKEQAQREYLEQQRRQSGEYVDPAELVARGQYEPGAGYPVGSAERARCLQNPLDPICGG